MKGDNNMCYSKDLLKLAQLFVESFEVGTRKSEWDVADEVFDNFGLSLNEIGKRHHLEKGIAAKNRARKVFRSDAAKELAIASKTKENLLSSVAVSGAAFIQMLSDIYTFLARYSSTTQGSSEEFKFRLGDHELDIPLSESFIETVRRYQRVLLCMDIGSIDLQSLGNFLRIDGDFYGSWPVKNDIFDNAKKSRNVAKNITYLPWLKDEIDKRKNQDQVWEQLSDVLNDAIEAACLFTKKSLNLVEIYVKYLESVSLNDLKDSIPENTPDWRTNNILTEWKLLREYELLRGGILRREVGLGEEKKGYWVNISIKSIFKNSTVLANVPESIVLFDRDPYPDFFGSEIGGLACLCGLWKAGIIRKPNPNEHLFKMAKDSDIKGISLWLTTLSTDLKDVVKWLSEEIWISENLELDEGIIEIAEEYLCLPLWKHRWLLYEIWLLTTTLDSAVKGQWLCEINTVRVKSGHLVWILPKGQAKKSCGRLVFCPKPQIILDVWYQCRKKRYGTDMMPDVSIRTPGSDGRDIIIIEGKDRYRMPIKSMRKGALTVGEKYMLSSGAALTWVVNYCEFAGKKLCDPTYNHGDEWHCLHFASGMRPGRIPPYFGQSIFSALLPLSYRDLITDVKNYIPFVVVLDTTGSMHNKLILLWDSLLGFSKDALSISFISDFWGILFGDHDQDTTEPYLLKEIGPCQSLESVVNIMKGESLTDGGDEPEALEDAMAATRQLTERLETPAIILVLTDAPPHPPELCPKKIDFEREVRELLGGGSHIIVLKSTLGTDAKSSWSAFEHEDRFHWIEDLKDLSRDFLKKYLQKMNKRLLNS